jgi:hypothetical protein
MFGDGVSVWCGSVCPSIGMNEGGHGKTVEKALAVLLSRNGFSDDYVIERDEVLVENPESGSFEAVPKPKGKRGRKAKVDVADFVIPSGQFTMKEFCEQNKTYPYKALPYFEKNGVKEAGKRSNNGARGKAATLYAVENQ